MNTKECLFKYILRLADDNMIHGQRLAEWCSRGPILEEDIALSNIALDMFGQAESFYEYAASLQGNTTADELAFRRSEREYYNHLIAEQPNGDFGQTIAKLVLTSAFSKYLFEALQSSQDETLKALCAKALKEVKYHLRHSSEWLIRLGDGTQESQARVQKGLEEMYLFVEDLFMSNAIDEELVSMNITVHAQDIRPQWEAHLAELYNIAHVQKPESTHAIKGGINAIHTEHLGHLLCEMQYLQRVHPEATW